MSSPSPVITSASNPLIKQLRRLTRAKERTATGQTLLEGVHLCQSYLANGQTPVYCIVDTAATEQPEVAQLLESLPEKTSRVTVASSLYATISPVKQSIGILFVIDTPTRLTPPPLANDAVLLDRLQDSGNVGTILRTAAAAGVTQVYLSDGCASAWSPATLRAGMGAHFGLAIYEHCDLNKLVKNSSITVYATSLAATKTLYDTDLSRPTGWLFGNEGSGVAPNLLTATTPIIIPQNSAVESLNVAAAVAVCLFEQVRQRH